MDGGCLLDEVGQLVGCPGRLAVVDRPVDVTGGLKVSQRAQVQRRNLVTLLSPQSLLQEIAKQMMIAIPLAAVVQGDGEQVLGLQAPQNLSRFRDAQELVAQTRGHPLQDRRRQEKRLNFWRLRGQHFLAQKVKGITSGAMKCLDEGLRGVARATQQGTEGQLQSGCPALRLLHQRLDAGGWQV